MDFSKIEERLIAIEARLSFIESKLELAPTKKAQ